MIWFLCSMVTAYATFEFQSDASLTFYKLQGAQFCGEKLHAVYAKKGELNRVMSEDFWAPGQSKSKAKPPDVFTPKKKSPKPSPSGKSKRSQQIPLENYLSELDLSQQWHQAITKTHAHVPLVRLLTWE